MTAGSFGPNGGQEHDHAEEDSEIQNPSSM